MPLEPLSHDFPEQFRNRNNIEILLGAFDRQFAEIYDVFVQLMTEFSINKAVGKQLDMIGEIVGLTRYEATGLASASSVMDMLDDDNYRRFLYYKILKNTCQCTYYDIMNAINMFWEGPPLRYKEEEDYPATIVFDFDASNNLGADVPFVKAGGVGMLMRMHKEDRANIKYGFVLQRAVTRSYECEIPVIVEPTYLTDTDGNILTDENNNWLSYDEEES